LRRKDLRLSRPNKKIVLRFRSFKHCQSRAKVTIRGEAAMDPSPFPYIKAFLCRVPGPLQGPLFDVPLAAFRVQLSEVMQHASIKTSLTPHSFRHGGATWAGRAGWPDARIKAHGRWRSDAYKLYVKGN
jgi:hypothetical protein